MENIYGVEGGMKTTESSYKGNICSDWKLSYERQEWKGSRLSSWVLTGSTLRCVFKYLYVTSRKTTIDEFSRSRNKDKTSNEKICSAHLKLS